MKIRDIAELLNLSERHIYRLIRLGIIRRRDARLTLESAHDYLQHLRGIERAHRASIRPKKTKGSGLPMQEALTILEEELKTMFDRTRIRNQTKGIK